MAAAKKSGLQRYKSRYKRQCANLEADAHLTKTHKREFRTHWSRFRSGSVEAFAKKFFYDPKRHQLGPEQLIDASELLGHLRRLDSLARRLTEFPSLGLDIHQATRLVRDLVFLNADSLKRRCGRMFRSGETLSAYLMWSYRNTLNVTDPFDGITLADLPCRLALPSFGSGQHIAFGHRKHTSTRYTIPTAFDAGLSQEWVPGGKTKPLSSCARRYPEGLPEIVHGPTQFDYIATRLQTI